MNHNQDHKKELYGCLKEMSSEVSMLRSRLDMFKSLVPTLETNQGISLLEVKLHSLLSYLSHLSFVVLLKLQGKSIVDHPSILSLIENRLVIEKIKPLEQKLKYQIDKLIKAAVFDSDQSQLVDKESSRDLERDLEDVDPLHFKPNPSALVSSMAEEEEVSQTYKPPKLAPMPYLEEEALEKRMNQRSNKVSMDKASRSRLLKDLSEQYDERPEETSIQGSGYAGLDVTASKEDKEWHERETFEEDHFTRLNMTRKDKKLAKKLSKKGAMLRFENEFEDLERDFKSMSKNVRDDFGPVKKKAMKTRESIKHQLQTKSLGKRTFDDANAFVSSASKTFGSQKPFKSALKRVKRSKK